MVKKAGNSYQEKYISNNQKYGKRGRFRRTLGALLLSVAGFGILTGCPPPFNPIPPKTTTTEQTTTPSDPSSSSIVVSSIDFSENEGDPVSYQVQASGGSGALTYSSKNVPSGLSMSSSGLITGTAHSTTQDETDPFTVTVTDSKGNSSSQNATFTDYNKPDFSGAICSVEDDTNVSTPLPGVVAVYNNSSGTPIAIPADDIVTPLIDGKLLTSGTSPAIIQTGSDNKFNFTVNKTKNNGLTSIVLYGALGDYNSTAVANSPTNANSASGGFFEAIR
ncbi:MAG: putative Ig domain-containing protein, partial [Nanoarchaeota archaeon]|nr:putative Ig domain-containing protein [Nanoarchaeota archaeon]